MSPQNQTKTQVKLICTLPKTINNQKVANGSCTSNVDITGATISFQALNSNSWSNFGSSFIAKGKSFNFYISSIGGVGTYRLSSVAKPGFNLAFHSNSMVVTFSESLPTPNNKSYDSTFITALENGNSTGNSLYDSCVHDAKLLIQNGTDPNSNQYAQLGNAMMINLKSGADVKLCGQAYVDVQRIYDALNSRSTLAAWNFVATGLGTDYPSK